MPQFVLLMTEDDDAWARLPPGARKSLLEKYDAWFAELKRTDRMRGGAPIGEPGRVLRVVGGAIVEAPYAETKGVLTGYFTIEAKDLADATAIARGCPALLHGETVIVRPAGQGEG